jgi:AraC family transcriptional regulator of adaptative response / DNA-3-methyladenine glycosylase II
MLDKDEALYQAYRSKDPDYDGKFVVAILGMFCRPTCRQRQTVSIRDCRFYETSNEAEQAGHRPCPFCRPEIPPKDPGKQVGETFTATVGYQPPYHWESMIRYLASQAISGVEVVEDGACLRTARFVSPAGEMASGWIKVANDPETNSLSVTLSETLKPVLPQVLAGVKHLFDLDCDPCAIYEKLKVMNRCKTLCVPGVRVPGCFEPFEMAVRAVLGQKLSAEASNAVAARVARNYGLPVDAGVDGLTHAFPACEDILAMGEDIEGKLGRLGVISIKSKAIMGLAKAMEQGDIDLDLPSNPEAEVKKLLKIKGVGQWTANYIAMRAMGWTDVFFETNPGVLDALRTHTVSEILKEAENWRPWRSYAMANLWNLKYERPDQREFSEALRALGLWPI